ncbi:hypothetical protein H4R21_001202, partial [Coemansia helicoidea]
MDVAPDNAAPAAAGAAPAAAAGAAPAAADDSAPAAGTAPALAPADINGTGGNGGGRKKKKVDGDLEYFSEAHKEKAAECFVRGGRCGVTIDPGHNHLEVMYGTNGKIIKLSKSEDEKTSRRVRDQKIVAGVKAGRPDILKAEAELASYPRNDDDPATHNAGLRCRFKHRPLLMGFYGHDGPRTRGRSSNEPSEPAAALADAAAPTDAGDDNAAAPAEEPSEPAAAAAAVDRDAEDNARYAAAYNAGFYADTGLYLGDLESAATAAAADPEAYDQGYADGHPDGWDLGNAAAGAGHAVAVSGSVAADPEGYAAGFDAGFLDTGAQLSEEMMAVPATEAPEDSPAYKEGYDAGQAAGNAVLSVASPEAARLIVAEAGYGAGYAGGYLGGAVMAGQEALALAQREADLAVSEERRRMANPVRYVVMPAADCSRPGQPLFMKLNHNAHLNREKANRYLRDKILQNFWSGTGKIVSRSRPPYDDPNKEEQDVVCWGQQACGSEICQAYVLRKFAEKRERLGVNVPDGVVTEWSPVASGVKTPKRVKDGYNIHPLTAFERKNLRPGQARWKYKRGNRARTTDVFRLPPGHPEGMPVRIFDRDEDGARTMMYVVWRVAKGKGYPAKYRRPKGKNWAKSN